MKLNRAAVLVTLCTLCACSSAMHSPTGIRTPSVGVEVSTPGEVIAVQALEDLDRAALQAVADELPGNLLVQDGAHLYRLTYWTRLHGQPVVASGLVSTPADVCRAKGVVLYAHGTTMTRALSPSEPGRADGLQETAVFAGNGFVVVIPDYIGLGQSSLPQAYAVVQPQVDASRDLLSAVHAWSIGREAAWHPGLLLMGFSQGGQTVAGLHRSLERTPLPGYDLRGSVAVSGPHDLRPLLLSKLRGPASTELNNVGYVAFAVSAYAHHYGVPLEDTFAQPYAERLPALFDGSRSIMEIVAQLPADARTLFRSDVLSDLHHDNQTWLTRALDENETYRWIPRAPFRILYGEADADVSASASKALYLFAAPRGGAVSLHSLGAVDHMKAGARAYAPTLAWFEELAASKQQIVRSLRSRQATPWKVKLKGCRSVQHGL